MTGQTASMRVDRVDGQDHYLKSELEELFGGNPDLVHFLGVGCLDGLWYWDLESPEHEWMNSRFWEILGHDPATKAHLASEWQDMIHPTDLAVAYENFLEHCDDPQHPYDQLVRYRHANGSTVWVRCRGIAIRDASGAPRRMLGVHTDVTELKQREAQLTAANAQLENFASLAAHDLQAPLRRSMLCVDIIRQEFGDDAASLPEPVRIALETLRSSSEQMRDLVRALTEFAQLQNREPQWRPVGLDAILREALEETTPDVEAAKPALDIGPLPEIEVDPALIRRLFANLLSNACRFRSASPLAISVSAVDQGETVSIAVADNGVGVPEDDRERVFEPFVRLHRRDQSGGVGIGLAMCKTIAELHGGQIVCAGAETGGSRFEVRLPRRRPLG